MVASAATPPSVWRNPIHFLSFGFGSGAIPIAPGTFGTLGGVLIYLVLPSMSAGLYILFLILAFLLGMWLCGKTSSDLGIHDHPGIVFDEFVGLWITYFMVPEGLQWLICGFCFFRVFDILKPWPIQWVDKNINGGLGIMLDDVLAGIIACLCIKGIAWIL